MLLAVFLSVFAVFWMPSFCPCQVTGLFYGMFRSEVKKSGSAKSSVTLEPFHCLQVRLFCPCPLNTPPRTYTTHDFILCLARVRATYGTADDVAKRFADSRTRSRFDFCLNDCLRTLSALGTAVISSACEHFDSFLRSA